MKEIKKYVLIKLLEEFEKRGCKTIEDIKKDINNHVKDDEIVFSWKEYK